MIKSFGDRDTELLAMGLTVPRFQSFEARARLKLRQLQVAASAQDLAVPPGNRLEKLRGKLNGYHSIRINGQWRVIFRWQDGAAHDVTVVDYH